MTPDQRLATIQKADLDGQSLEIALFWGHRRDRDGRIGRGCLSQWWPASFSIDDQMYLTAEHWMMVSKARLFHDREALQRILASDSPGAAKAAGRTVQGFDERA